MTEVRGRVYVGKNGQLRKTARSAVCVEMPLRVTW